MAEYDIIIRGGLIVDGTRTPAYVSDVAIKDGRIARIGGLSGQSAGRVLDASGLIVAPGFVDLHTHYDAQIQWDPYCTISGWHGATSMVIGNCGFGFAPCRVEDQDRAMLAMTRNESIPFDPMKAGMIWDWVTFPEFLETIDRIHKGVNVISYVPLSPVYAWVMGHHEAKTRRPTEAELKEMCRLVDEGMDAGACGWSAQVNGPNNLQMDYDGTPMITDLMTDEELLAFAGVLGRRGEGSIELAYRAATEEAGESMPNATTRFFEKVAQTANRPVIYQEVSPKDDKPERHKQTLSWLEECARKHVRVYGQGNLRRADFELTFEDWNLFDASPGWREVTLGTSEERRAKMQDPELRRAMRAEWDAGMLPDGGFFAGSLPAFRVKEVGSRELEGYVGQTVEQIAREEVKHIVDALLDIVVEDNLETEFVAPLGRENPEYMAEITRSPYTVHGASDGGAHIKFQDGGSCSTQLLTWLVRDEGLVSLEDAHFKLSYLPAFVGGLKDRGFLREGAPADVVVYDLDKLDPGPVEVLHDLPGGDWRRVQRPKGYRWIMVNGQVTQEDGTSTGALPGNLLRHGRG